MGCGIGPRQKGNTKKPKKATTVSCKVSANETGSKCSLTSLRPGPPEKTDPQPMVVLVQPVQNLIPGKQFRPPTYPYHPLSGGVPPMPRVECRLRLPPGEIGDLPMGLLFTVPSNVYSAPPGRASLLGRPYHGESPAS